MLFTYISVGIIAFVVAFVVVSLFYYKKFKDAERIKNINEIRRYKIDAFLRKVKDEQQRNLRIQEDLTKEFNEIFEELKIKENEENV